VDDLSGGDTKLSQRVAMVCVFNEGDALAVPQEHSEKRADEPPQQTGLGYGRRKGEAQSSESVDAIRLETQAGEAAENDRL
jgi:hypothetical protein